VSQGNLGYFGKSTKNKRERKITIYEAKFVTILILKDEIDKNRFKKIITKIQK
jgi:hypothetical protein